MANLFDNGPLEITCPNCKKKIKQTVAWFKTGRVSCPFCKTLIDAKEFRRELESADVNVTQKQEYLDRLKLVIEHLHKCSARFLRSERVKEEFNGKTLWEGEVEVFGVTGHPKAKRCYGWSYGEPE